MKNTSRFIASTVLLTLAFAAFSHESHEKAAKGSPPAVAEQTAWGIAGQSAKASRTINIEMRDTMRFEPALITVREGETVRLRALNKGRVLHEIVLGTADELARHAALMKKFPDMEHDEPYMAHVAAGKRGDIVWTFNRPGTFEFACLIPGHFEAGMVGKIVVTAR